MAFGDITFKDSINRLNVGPTHTWCKAYGDYWALLYRKTGTNDLIIETYTIDPVTGLIGDAAIDTHTFAEATINGAGLFHATYIADGVIAIWYRQPEDTVGGDGKLVTVGISSVGVINHSVLGNITWKVISATETFGSIVDAIAVIGTIWAFPYSFGINTGAWAYSARLATVSISLDGITLSLVDDEELIAGPTADRYNIIKVSHGVYASCCQGVVITSAINSVGAITTAALDSNDFTGSNSWIVKLDTHWWVMTFRNDSDTSGDAGSFKITNAGIIDNAFTDIAGFDSAATIYTICMSLGQNNGIAYLILNNKGAASDSFIRTMSVSITGTLALVDLFEWSAVTLFSHIMRRLAYDMFLISANNSSGDDIYTSSLLLVAATPGGFRVTNIVHRYDRKKEIYNLELVIGGVTSDFGFPEWSSEPQAAVRPTEDEINTAAREYLFKTDEERAAWEELAKALRQMSEGLSTISGM